jgi:hypothetical protein
MEYKISQQEIEDIKLVSESIFLDGTFASLPPERKTKLVCLAALQADTTHLKDVPKKYQTEELILSVLRKDGTMLSAVDNERRTPEMYATAIENDCRALWYFPPEMITAELALKAVQQNGTILEFVPENIKTPEICHAALNSGSATHDNDFEIIEYVPFPDVCMEHLQKYERENRDPFMVFGSINPKIITPEMAQLAVGLEPLCIQFVPDGMKTTEMCTYAVEKDWTNMRYIPANLKTKTLCETAVNRNILAQQFVPERLKTPEMYMNTVKANGMLLQYVPEKFRTPEVCLQAVKSNPEAKEFVPERFFGPYNIYEFYHGKLKNDFISNELLSFEQIHRLFKGETVTMSGIIWGNARLWDFTLDYDKKTNQLDVKVLDEKQEKKQSKKIENKSFKRK